PKRSCMRPSSLRSSHVVKAKNTITTLTTRNAFGIVIHHASLVMTAPPPAKPAAPPRSRLRRAYAGWSQGRPPRCREARPAGRRRRQLARLADLAVGDAAEALGRDLVEDDRRIGRERDVEALGKLRDPRDEIGARRDHGPPLALQPPLEVDGRAVAL